jgi:hypothetical protein
VAISLAFNIRDCHAVARNDENGTFSTGPLLWVLFGSKIPFSSLLLNRQARSTGWPLQTCLQGNPKTYLSPLHIPYNPSLKSLTLTHNG